MIAELTNDVHANYFEFIRKDNKYQIKVDKYHFLDVRGWNSDDGTNIILYSNTDNENQRFSLEMIN